MSKEEVRIKALKHQLEFLNSRFTHTGLVGGFGSGKTFAGVLKTVIKKLNMPDYNVAYYMPTYPLIKDVAFPKFAELLDTLKIPYTLNRSDKEFITGFGKIILRTMDNPDLIVGYEVGYSLIDEADILPIDKMKNAFVKIVARNRKPLKDGSANQLDFVSTPEGFKFLYDFFIKKPGDNKRLIKAKTADNPHNPESYIKTLQDSYPPELLDAYLNGEFVNLTSGNVYRNYDRFKCRSLRTADGNDTLHIGMDFNITKMNAVIHIVDGKVAHAVDEVVNAYDTLEICEIIKKKYPNRKVIIYPDASGSARSTSGKSDHDIIRSFGFTIRVGNKNPFVRDRVNAVNLAFSDGNYFVNDNECPVYSEALERQSYRNSEPDKQSGFDHITEAGGYCIYNLTKAKISYSVG